MAGLLDSDFIQDLFGSVFSPIYGDGELIRTERVRQPNGSFVPQEEPPVPIKVQVDVCTEDMRRQDGFSDTDVRLLILQAEVQGRAPNNDDIVLVRGQRWKIAGIRQDPGTSYWEMRGIRQAGS